MGEASDEGYRLSRQFSAREITLGVGLLFNFGTLMWQLSAANTRFEIMRGEMEELKQSNARLVSAVSQNLLLEYRVTELEKRSVRR